MSTHVFEGINALDVVAATVLSPNSIAKTPVAQTEITFVFVEKAAERTADAPMAIVWREVG